jgi:lipopolysaccharide transport system ATP-binding protein
MAHPAGHQQPADERRVFIRYRVSGEFREGSYSIQTALVDRGTHLTANYEWRDMALVFNVIINIDKTQFAGCLWNEPHIRIESLT